MVTSLAMSVFALCAFWIAYVYVLYPLFLILVGRIANAPPPRTLDDDEFPTVSFLIPAYNEEAVLAQKIENTLALDYPSEKLEISIASDRSTDRTDEIAKSYADRGVRFIRNEVQKGKISTLSELGMASTSDIILITDANAIYEPDSLRRLMSHFADPRVGMVNGNKMLERTDTMVGDGEGTYQDYETMLKKAESSVLSNVFVTGAMSAIRKELFFDVPDYLEFDHVLPTHVVNQGYRVAFADDAGFYEETAPHSEAEYKVRVRNATRGFTMVLLLREYLDIGRHPAHFLHMWSRKVLRWLIAVPAIGLFLSSAVLLDLPFFQLAFAAQLLFYAAAALAWGADRLGYRHGILALPFYFCLVNFASLVGCVRAMRGQRISVWATNR
jgi:cellulose synthase/poly-beta-1,6-N-acetylglucosamine synthase-like glycosyltransferase